MDGAAILLPLSGLAAGTALGYIARRNFFCTLSSLEQYWFSGNPRGLRIWGLAVLTAIALTLALEQAGILDPAAPVQSVARFGWLGAVVGGLLFGWGMALVGTCGFGALVRLGGGSLKSLMAILVLGIAALSAQRGLVALARSSWFDGVVIDFSFAGTQRLPDILQAWIGPAAAAAAVLALLTAGSFLVFREAGFRADRKALATGAGIGALIAFGWLATSLAAGASLEPVQVESASFVAPVADSLMQLTLFTGSGPDYGVGMVFGVVLGAAIAARQADDVRWEACDDARELSRHIIGAAFMGVGGILALGCTIGQGMSAASLMTVSAPVTLAAILVGARLGLAWLLEGTITGAFRRE